MNFDGLIDLKEIAIKVPERAPDHIFDFTVRTGDRPFAWFAMYAAPETARAFEGPTRVLRRDDENGGAKFDFSRQFVRRFHFWVKPFEEADHPDQIMIGFENDQSCLVTFFTGCELFARQRKGRVHPARHTEDLFVPLRCSIPIAHQKRGAFNIIGQLIYPFLR